jgi:hypothetical protein
MPLSSPYAPNQPLNEVVSAARSATIEDVVARMEAIDSLLPDNDGLKWFNRLYLMVTEQVDLHPPGGAWQSPGWLTTLDTIFADLYFGAVRGTLNGETVPSAWNAIFETRFQSGVDRIQFAVAGMNAHINHDLALAVLSTNTEMNVTPTPGSPEYADYQSINNLLNGMMPSALNMLATDVLGVVAEDTGKVGRILAFWNICRARELAWDFSIHLRSISGLTRDAALGAQDAMTGVLGRAILAAV